MKVIVAIALIVLSSSPTASSQVPAEKLIVPGERIGKWVLPVTIDRLVEMNGPKTAIGGGPVVIELPNLDQQPTKMWVHRWDSLGLRVVTIGTPDTQEVFNLTIGLAFNPSNPTGDYRTERGVGFLVTREGVEGAYGKPTAVTQASSDITHLIYDELGLALGIFGGRVYNIIVFRKGTANQRWRF